VQYNGLGYGKWDFGWSKWRDVARSDYLDVLGIDFYRDQIWMWAEYSVRYAAKWADVEEKPWYIIETSGAGKCGPTGYDTDSPTCDQIKKYVKEAVTHSTGDPDVIGFYRLWGNYEVGGDRWSNGYNIYTNPGTFPVENTDLVGKKYSVMIRDFGE